MFLIYEINLKPNHIEGRPCAPARMPWSAKTYRAETGRREVNLRRFRYVIDNVQF